MCVWWLAYEPGNKNLLMFCEVHGCVRVALLSGMG